MQVFRRFAETGRAFVGMRWWLAAAFAAVAALTAAVAVRAVSDRTESALRRNAEALAVGYAVGAAESIKASPSEAAVRTRTAEAAARRRVTLFVFDGGGHLVAAGGAARRPLATVPHADDAIAQALAGDRFIHSDAANGEIVVALPVRGKNDRALLEYVRRPEVRTQLGIVHNVVFRSALWATVLGAAAGLLIATLIAMRLQRMAAAAKRIESGDFARPVGSGFPDEVGRLGASLDSMRVRLSGLFTALEGERGRLERLLDRLRDGVLLLDRDLSVEFANAAARELLEVPSLEGKPLPQTSAVGSVLIEFARASVGAREGDQRRVTFADERVLLLSAIPPSESNESLILVIVDETERDRAERAQREFSTNAAHQLRTPVTAIVSSIEMLQTGAKEDPAARDSFLDAIEEQADRLTRLTRALLTLARAEARQEEPQAGRVAIESLLARVVRNANDDGRPDVQVVADPVDAWVDADLLEQALVSVLENAYRYTRSGSITLEATQVGDSIRISITDSGPGMSAEERSHAFDRFYRGMDDRDGFGLGLAIARQALTAVGGTISLDSTRAKGTTVRIEVPASREAVPA